MTNDNNNSNELVDKNNETTAEFEALTDGYDQAADGGAVRGESEASTFDMHRADSCDDATIADLRSDLAQRSDTIECLQFDMAQLRSKWIGLGTEIKAREDMYRDLQRVNAEPDDEINVLRQRLATMEGRLATSESRLRETDIQQLRTEQYADQLRRRLGDISSSSEDVAIERESLASELAGANERIDSLSLDLSAANDQREALATTLENIEKVHAEEIRMLRFELCEAEETLAQNEHISEELASDLVDNRGFRDQLERMLEENDKDNSATLEKLERKLKTLENTLADNERRLETKSQAINGLLGELSRKSKDTDSIGEIEGVIHELDNCISERSGESARVERERVTRLLVGRIGGQELRFPLFKNRLTIGRTQQNDIQLKAQYISRRHAVITTEGNVARVIDWGSRNGVYVNSRRVTEHFLEHGDIVTIGVAEFRYVELPKRDL